MNTKSIILFTAIMTSSIYADYSMTISQNEITLNQGEIAQLEVIMDTTDLWFGADLGIESIASAPGLISSIEAGSMSLLPGTIVTGPIDIGVGSTIGFADQFLTGYVPGSYQMAVINVDTTDIATGQYEINLLADFTNVYDGFFMPIDQDSLSGGIINVVPAPATMALGFLGITRFQRRRPS